MGDDARDHEARRGDHADDDRGRARRPARPDRPRRRPVRHRQRRRHRQVRRRDRRLRRLAVTRGEAAPEGWESLDDAYRLDVPPAEHPGTAPEDRLLLYFTSGTTTKPKLVEHTQVSYPVGHLATMYWLGLRTRRRAPQHLLARLGEARVVVLLRALDRRGDDLPLQLHAVRRGRPARRDPRQRGHLALRAADRVADAHQRRPLRRPRPTARGHRRRRAAEPRGHRAGEEGVGPDAPGRLRPDRDHRPGRQHPGVRR